MSQHDILISRALCIPKDFTYDELVKLVSYFGYKVKQGKGSRVKFYRELDKKVISIHKPHSGNIVKQYILRIVIDNLKDEGEI